MKRLKIIQTARKGHVCLTGSTGLTRGFDEGPLPPRHSGVIRRGESYGLYHAYGEQRAACVWCVAAAFGREVSTPTHRPGLRNARRAGAS